MGVKLLWTGLTIIMAFTSFIKEATIVGGVIMVIGAVLMWLDK